MIALIIVHVLLLMRSDKEIAGGLRKLSGQIENSLQHELEMAGDQMAFFDRQLDSAVAGKQYPPGQPMLELRKETGSVYHMPWWDSALSNGKVKAGRDNTYAYFNRMSWIDREGKQTLKVQIDEPWSIKFIKVSDRRYYQAFKGNRPDDTLLLAMEPVNSWTNGDFEINLSIRSRTAYQVLAMSTHLYSLQQVIMSSGYSYCLMDSAGSMYTHSDLRKALKDNFIEETGARRPVLEAIAGHQDTVLRNILLYSRPHSIFIHPLKSSSLFLVTMYDESYYIAVHLRILAFALLCLPVCAAMVILGMLVLYWIPNRHVLFSPAEYAQWMLPRSGLRPYYKAGCLFMVLYQALFWLWLNGADAYLLFFIGCLTPLNVLAVLAALRSYYNTILKQEQDILHIRIVAIIVLQGAGTLAVGYCAGIPVGAGWSFFLFQACVCALALVLTDRKGRVEQLYYSLFPVSPPWRFNRFGRILRQISWWPVWRWMKWDYLYWHAIFIFLLTQCISSLPAILFTWYAQNHEIRQSVKKEQLYLASKLQNRKPSIYHFLQSHDVNVVSHRYIDTIAYARGIYTLYDEKVSRPAIGAAQVTRQDAAILNNKAENFYLEMVNGIIANKKDPLNYPALRNLSSDRQWSWDNRLKDTLEFLWHPSREAMFARKDTTVDPLLIRSKMPDRYVMVQRPVIKFLLMVIGFLIAYGIIALIRMTIYRFFSLRFVHWQEKGRAAGSPFPPIRDSEFLQQCYDRNRYLEKIETGGHACLRDYFRAGYSRNDGRLSTNKAELMEAQIMNQADSCKVFFGELWKSCSNEDKLLLMNLAQYGVVNYKNTEGIFRLLKRELVIVYDGRIHMLSPAFRYFILNRAEQPEEQELRKQSLKAGRWQQVRMVLLLLMLLTGIFLFITQEEAFKRVGAVLTSVTGVVSLLMKFVSDASPAKK
ncbi:hypothetical protein [Paraflavitalea sp. CAU 1676]|uniref:hypothetical protein n=1 Tax=Paraflavitalea sp. CAU 1676 TaxID=3032598 RepID=UPI0023DC4BB1|nr:hypothetical protein [Paraflavitalea sp. CAU 1676]MDF2190262.1 hypothetical protein [Paraflavitalea sp. CAU 1676]